MEIASSFQVLPVDEEKKPGAYAIFPYDRDLVQRFRAAFPRARWRAEEQRWFVPGTTAARRIDVWIAQELASLDRHADAKGRDAFSFDPLDSPYLTLDDDLQVRTPYSRTIVEALRAIPWAHWDPAKRVWRVPFRSYEELKARWPEIEESARRNEPDARRRRREEQKGHGSEETSLVQAERRRRRYPVPGEDAPPLGVPLSTNQWGVVVFEAVDVDPSDELMAFGLYPHVRGDPSRYVWAHWRMPMLQEIYRAKPIEGDAKHRLTRGWWWASREELQERARKLREIERGQRSRDLTRKTAEA